MPDAAPRDPELMLALAYAPADARVSLTLLLELDERLGAIVGEKNRPIAAIKLAWWREALERLDVAPPPPEPLLRGLAEQLLPMGITGGALATIAGGWDALIDDEDDEPVRLARHAAERGGTLFHIAASILGGAGRRDVDPAGQAWALATVPSALATGARAAARARFATLARSRWPRRLRALGIITALARDRLFHEEGGARYRAARALWLGISGW